MDSLADLQERHRLGQISDAEILEYYERQINDDSRPRSRGYAQLIAAMHTFVPYLVERPQLIPDFVKVIYKASQGVFAGVKDRAGFFQFLESKAQVDDALGLALKLHRAEFEAAFDKLEGE